MVGAWLCYAGKGAIWWWWRFRDPIHPIVHRRRPATRHARLGGIKAAPNYNGADDSRFGLSLVAFVRRAATAGAPPHPHPSPSHGFPFYLFTNLISKGNVNHGLQATQLQPHSSLLRTSTAKSVAIIVSFTGPANNENGKPYSPRHNV